MQPLLISLTASFLLAFLVPNLLSDKSRQRGTPVVLLSFLTGIVPMLLRMFFPSGATPEELVADLSAASLLLLLVPVPYDSRIRIRALEFVVPVIPLTVFVGVPVRLAFLLLSIVLLISRGWQGIRRKRYVRHYFRSCRHRQFLYESFMGSVSLVWLGIMLSCDVSRSAPYCMLLPALSLYAVLNIQAVADTPMALAPRYAKILSDLSREPRRGGGEEGADEEPERKLYARCCQYMQTNRPYLVETFSIGDLANAVYTNKTYLSKTINQVGGKNFRQYVNEYRVTYSKDLYMRNMSLRVIDLAELSGFHTVTTYTMAFKLVMDESPSSWCRRMRIASLSPGRKNEGP